jgi:hypothetical protein
MNASPSPVSLVDTGWAEVQGELPANLEALARQHGALLRKRELPSAEALLRIALAYAVLDLSLRGVASWMPLQGLPAISDVAVLGRLRQADGFLEAVLLSLLQPLTPASPGGELPLRVVLADATALSVPGSPGTDYRIHVGYDPANACIDQVRLTDEHSGETLQHFQLRPGELWVADRCYGRAKTLLFARDQGAHLLVRFTPSHLHLYDAQQNVIPVLDWAEQALSSATPGTVAQRTAFVQSAGQPALPVRLLAVRKTEAATERELKRIRRRASRKGQQVRPETLRAAAYVLLLSTVREEQASGCVLAELYRVRWQVELLFKRLKSLLSLDALRAHDPALVRTYLWAKLIAAVLIERWSRRARAFPP